MKKTNYNQAITVLLVALLMVFLVGCGTKDATPVAEEDATVVTEEPTEEVEIDPNATYVEINELNYEENTKIISKGVLYVGEDVSNLKVIDIDWEVTNVVMEDAEDGTKIVTIEQAVHGYIWSDGENIFATNLNVPVARLADAYTGKMICVGDEAAVANEIKWKENVYTVSATEITSWEDGNWDTDWIEDPDGGERLSSTLKITTIVKITEGYDGLALALVPITDANGNIDGKYIMDVWTDDSYLFNVKEMSAIFVSDAEEVEETDADEAATSADEESEEESKEEAKPAETTTPKEEHTHSYTSTDSPSSCVVSGVRTYVCNCGDSYTENLGYGSHNFSIPIYESVFHDEVWQTTPRTIKVTIIHCSCGYSTTSEDEFQNHCVERINAGYLGCGMSDWYEYKDETVYDQVKVSDAYTSEEIVGYKCSVCGQQQK